MNIPCRRANPRFIALSAYAGSFGQELNFSFIPASLPKGRGAKKCCILTSFNNRNKG